MGGREVWGSVGDHKGLSFGYFFLLLHNPNLSIKVEILEQYLIKKENSILFVAAAMSLI